MSKEMKQSTKESIIILIGMSIMIFVVGFSIFALWALGQPQFQKSDKLITQIIDCDTDGVVCK